MTTRTALFALLAMWGVGTGACLPVVAAEAAAEAIEDEGAAPLKRSLANRVWVRSDTDDRPGVMRIFLSDGTLVQDSCWETHRLSEWRMTSENGLSWNEDGMEIKAQIVSVTADSLVLSIAAGSEALEERYATAEVPYVCPDLPKA